MKFDVIIAGGGPGGSICAAALAQKGRRVLVLEKARFPRFHLGESLLPQSMPILDALGLMPELHRRFLVKRGANFHEHGTGKSARYDFAEAFDRSTTYAFEVPRDEFDEVLLRRAESLGAEIREGWTVTRIVFDGGRAVGVEAKTPEGATQMLPAHFVVDATGRDALHAHTTRTTVKVPRLDKTALFSHFRGAYRDTGDREGDIQIVIFPAGWFWVIPFKDGRTSVGAVVSSAWMKTRAPGESVDALYRRAIQSSDVATRMLQGAEQLFPAEATADFSFRVQNLVGPGWLTIGDAGGFIDPLFSTGAHLAMYGGFHAGDAIHQALTDGDVAPARFAPWEQLIRRGAEMFLGSVQAFYDGTLTEYLFADKPHPFMKRSITSMLVGDVFNGDARWTREIQQRFPAVLE
ncbi:NAD(P)/FAD-dependent oxidoreductase [Pendulispora albinea]|uniref:Tryptophan 7-halogenase n=1 Tax=Pendulispora albinea TaxID=2741071 RepID=A0ABZ2LU45_9BACT